MAEEKVRDGLVVGIDYVMTLSDGEVVDTTEGEEPLEILQGAGEVVEGLEKALYGLHVGDSKHVVVSPEEGFGEREEGSEMAMPRSEFPRDFELEEGMEIYVQTDEDDEPVPVYVVSVDRNEVVVDFNHPLAGETLHFDVTVRSLRPPTEEELAHGHAHDDDEWDEEWDDEEEWDEE
ncbi:MAG: peptidylprolyl isomerase [Ardenticatenaceae bacterium]|nr:peptidylprolyl isomerase [Ardenticatenaceae bacterium]HBY97808.1 peptidylprolyl isomerase [Chloroflexota bacterium]